MTRDTADGNVGQHEGIEGSARGGPLSWKMAAVPAAVVATFFAIDLAADIGSGVKVIHLGLDVAALCFALLLLVGAVRKR